MIPFPAKKYNVIYVDPPWGYLDEAKKAREHAERYQQTETTNKGDKKQ